MNEHMLEDYLVNYLPGLVSRLLAEDPVPGMEGTAFTLMITVTGEKDFSFGITIKDARQMTVTPGGLDHPQVALQIPEQAMKPLVKMVSALTGRSQYDRICATKGSMDLEIGLPGGQDLPVRMVFNGVREPNFKMTGSSADLAGIASGSIDPARAFLQGMIKLYGDLAFALQLSQIVPKKL